MKYESVLIRASYSSVIILLSSLIRFLINPMASSSFYCSALLVSRKASQYFELASHFRVQ